MIYKKILRIFQNSNRTEAIKNGNYLKEALIKIRLTWTFLRI